MLNKRPLAMLIMSNGTMCTKEMISCTCSYHVANKRHNFFSFTLCEVIVPVENYGTLLSYGCGDIEVVAASGRVDYYDTLNCVSLPLDIIDNRISLLQERKNLFRIYIEENKQKCQGFSWKFFTSPVIT